MHGRGPFSIQQMDMETGQISTVAESADYDLLSPKIDSNSTLFYIRRPYVQPGKRPGWRQTIFDIPLMPFRFLYAIFQYLNWFTVSYTGRMLTSAGSAKQKEIDLERRKVLANLYGACKDRC